MGTSAAFTCVFSFVTTEVVLASIATGAVAWAGSEIGKKINHERHRNNAEETHESFPYAIFQFIDGEHISEVSREHKKSLSYDLGQTLASIHTYKFQKAGLFGERIIIANPFDEGSSPYFEEAVSVLSKGKYARTR